MVKAIIAYIPPPAFHSVFLPISRKLLRAFHPRMCVETTHLIWASLSTTKGSHSGGSRARHFFQCKPQALLPTGQCSPSLYTAKGVPCTAKGSHPGETKKRAPYPKNNSQDGSANYRHLSAFDVLNTYYQTGHRLSLLSVYHPKMPKSRKGSKTCSNFFPSC